MFPTAQANTIFLTSEEDNRIRTGFKDKLEKCNSLSGQPRIPRNTKFWQNRIATASLLADFGSTSPSINDRNLPDAMVVYAVGSPYPPCTLAMQDLQPIGMSDLLMDTHHRGMVLVVQRVAPVVKLVACSWTIVQDKECGEMERLEVGLHKSSHGQDILEAGEVFWVKEPYFTLSDQGEFTIRIDHPSDLVICRDSPDAEDPILDETENFEDINAVKAPRLSAATKAKQCKEEGNAALKQRNLHLAHSKYTKGLQLLATEEESILTHDLHRNRAYVNLLLHRFEEAKTDALASLTGLEDQKHKDLDSKAYSRAGQAAYNLSQFQEAKCFFEHQQRLAPGDKESTTRSRKVETRLREQDTGLYNFKKLKASILVSGPRVDVASFERNVQVRDSPGCGRGLFALRDIGVGEIVLCEKAFRVVWGHESEALTAMTYDSRDERIRVFPAGLCKAVMQKLVANPSQAEKVMDLYGDYRSIDRRSLREYPITVIDSFQIHDIVARNAFGPGPAPAPSSSKSLSEETSNASAGLWILASYVNHSCMPNAEKEYIGDLMVLRATRPISIGEEITHSYDASSDYDARTAALMNTWGFTCSCMLCEAEREDGTESRKRRRVLETEGKAFVEKESAVGAKRMAVVKARRLMQSINETYNDERYEGLPRRALQEIQRWLAQANVR